jgi:pimeloyl-ACP methyl ester carboxylesterase
VRLHRVVEGDGRPFVVIPGGPGFDHAHLRPGLDPLAGDARLVYVDLRNTGASEHGPLESWTLEQSLELIREDECVEVTPKSNRLRKVELSAQKRQTATSRAKRAAASVG